MRTATGWTRWTSPLAHAFKRGCSASRPAISAITRAWAAGSGIYFGKDGSEFVLLLLGGDKSTQTSDVARAQASWKAYQEDKRRDKTK
jgi:putative addiction module killer protein